MTYAGLSAAFLVVAVAAASVFALLSRRRPRMLAVGITVAVLLALTVVFDSLMIGAGLFHYAPEQLLGVSIGLAPIEDLAYPIAGALLLPALWTALRARPGSTRVDDARLILLSSRPISWINTAFPFGAAYLLAGGGIDATLVVGALYFLVPYNLAMYGINDVFDYASDIANPRKGGIEGALLPPRLHRPLLWLAAAANVPFLAYLVFVGGLESGLWLALSVFAVIAYSAPGLRFKERPFLDSLTSSLHFVTPAVIGWTITGTDIDPATALVFTAFLLWGAAAHAFGAVQDVVPDREAGIASIATVIGARATVRLALVLWIAAGATMLLTPWPGPLAAVLVVPYLVNAAPWWNVTDAASGNTNRAWRRFIALNYLAGFLATLILILAVAT